MLIAQDLFLGRLIQSRHTRLIKVVTGIRRCGKSFFLTRLFHRWLLDNGGQLYGLLRLNSVMSREMRHFRKI